MPKLFVLDAMGLAYRAYYAFIRRPLVNSRNENTSAIFGFANTVLKIRGERRPDYWALAWDGPGPTHRHALYGDYKATRKPMPPDLLAQIPAIEEVAGALGLPVVEVPGVEADDVMATLARRGAADGFEVVLVTSDKDMLQLVGDHVRLLSPVGRGEEYAWVDAAAVKEKWGVPPERIRDVLALMGDSSDNVPGVPGVGPKTATELIQRFGSIEDLYRRIAEVERAPLRERLAAGREKAFLSHELVTVKTDCDVPADWEALKVGPIRRDTLLEFAKRFELVRLERVAMTGGTDAGGGDAPPARGGETRARARGGATARSNVATAPPPARDRAPAAAEPELDWWAAVPVAEPPARDEDAEFDLGGEARPAELRLDEVVEAPSLPIDLSMPPAPPPFRDAPERIPEGDAAAPAAPRGASPAEPPAQERLDLFAADEADLGALEARLDEVRARGIHGIALLPLVDGDDPRSARLVGVALAARDGTAAYVPLAHAAGPNFTSTRVREALSLLLSDPTVPKVGEDLKRDVHALASAGLVLAGLGFDLHLASFLCDPAREHDRRAIARDFLGTALEGPAERATASSPVARTAEWAERDAALLHPAAEALRAQLESRGQWKLYETLEHPLVRVLVDMERAGVLVDTRVLAEMSREAGGEVEVLEAKLYELAGERVNLNSGPQLARVLFEKFGLAPGRRTKTGYSTDQAVLEELAPSHPFPSLLLEYRSLAKLKSTYLDALPQMVDARDGRIHTTFNQAGAATGRLSSSNPNLQNIPMRSGRGRAIRRAFVAPEGRVLVGADYSQIELRVMAHLSQDPNLIEAFRGGEDIHASTARRVFNVEGPLDPSLRARAKIVNFGIMYGMGARSLSQQMGIPLAEAQEFIAHYFRVYAGVREYLDSIVDEARRRGWVETLCGRRRYLPDLIQGSGATRAFAERAAINTPIQGSAADLMKLAMIRVHGVLKRSNASARLLLQVHDELLIECAADEAEAVSEQVRREMEGCFPLRVPLEVSVGRGATWFDVH